jgi:hypothetical protein
MVSLGFLEVWREIQMVFELADGSW